MDLFDSIKGRTSIRRFKQAPVPDEDIRKILDAGRLAPSANNTQPWSFLVIKDKETLKKMAAAVREMVDRMIPHAEEEKHAQRLAAYKGTYYTFFENAPVVIAVFMEGYDAGTNKLLGRMGYSAEDIMRLRPNPGETDVCVMWCSVEGEKDGHPARVDYWLWDQADTITGISSMGRVTGFSAAIAAWMLGKGMFPQIGVVAPEDCFDGPRYHTYVNELAKHDINILEEVTPVEPSGEALRQRLAR